MKLGSILFLGLVIQFCAAEGHLKFDSGDDSLIIGWDKGSDKVLGDDEPGCKINKQLFDLLFVIDSKIDFSWQNKVGLKTNVEKTAFTDATSVLAGHGDPCKVVIQDGQVKIIDTVKTLVV